MELTLIGDIVKVYGPLGIGWVVAAYLILKDQARQDKKIESDIKLAVAFEGLRDVIKASLHSKG